jgi:hypothetical protein
MRHVHGVDVYFAEEGRRVVDGWWKPDFGGLTDLALVTSLNVPLYVSVKCRPPEVVKKGVAHGVETLMAELVIGIMNKHVPNGGAGIKLMSAAELLPPEASSSNEKTVHSADKMG